MIANESPLFDRLLDITPFSPRELDALIQTAPFRYKEHYIEKRHGRGKRLISQPTAELKLLQRAFVHEELSSLSVHPVAVGYRKGCSILDHAAPHASARYLLKLDFKDFFPSLDAVAISYRLSADKGYSSVELALACQILCRYSEERDRLELSIGAPSSPFVSNYLLCEFDGRLADACEVMGAAYTRYADDIAISTDTPRLLDYLYFEVKKIISELDYLSIKLNESKTLNVSRKHRRTLVGLRLSNSGDVSIGRDEKRKLRAAVHQLSHGKASLNMNVAQLRGRLAFLYSVDPDFVLSLCAKNGFQSISDIRNLGSETC